MMEWNILSVYWREAESIGNHLCFTEFDRLGIQCKIKSAHSDGFICCLLSGYSDCIHFGRL